MAHNSVAMFFLAFTMMQQLSPGQYDPWNAWGRRVRPPHGIDTMPIRQSHVQQDDVHSSLRKMNLSFAHAQEVRQFETVRPLSPEHLAEQADVSRVILNQKNLECLFFHECGN
jgi:hypothetical protein